MSAAEDTAGSADAAPQGEGVLSNLPHTRPQRSSARRVAAREAEAGAGKPKSAPAADGSRAPRRSRTSAKATPKATTAPARKPKSAKPKAVRPSAARQRAQKAPRSASAARLEPVPRQGYASEGDRVSGPVSPPGSTEFLATAAEIVGELAKAGASRGERLLKDALSRLPLG